MSNLSKSPQTYMDGIKQLLDETKKAYTNHQIAEELNYTNSNVYNSTVLMMAFNVIERRKAAGRYYFFLKDKYSEEELAEMLPKPKPKPAPKPRKKKIKAKTKKATRPRELTEHEQFMKDYLGDLEIKSASAPVGLGGLAILGLPDIDSVRPKTDPIRNQKSDPVPVTGIKVSATLKVKELSKNMRRLPRPELNYLKNIFKQYSWFPVIENLNTGYVKFKALKSGRYGDTFHFSKGSNPWDDLISVHAGSSISSSLLLPSHEKQRWSSWNSFNKPAKTIRPYLTGVYDEMLNKFIDSGHHLVEITMKTRSAVSARISLKYHIDKRGLQEQIEVSRVRDFVYLEKLS